MYRKPQGLLTQPGAEEIEYSMYVALEETLVDMEDVGHYMEGGRNPCQP